MPTLKEYFAPDAEQAVNVRAGEAGQEATVRAGRLAEEHARTSGAIVAQGIGEIGRGVAQAGTDATKVADEWTYSHDVVKQDAALANLQADKLAAYNAASKTWDPNDIQAPRKWMEANWEPAQEQYQNGFTNRRAAERGEQMWRGATEHMDNVVTVDTAERAGAAQLLNLQKLGQGVENMASSDASSTPRAHAQIDAAVATAKEAPGVDARHSAAYDEWAVAQHRAVDTASLEGMLVSNPAGAAKLAANGFWQYLPAGKVGQAIQTAQRLHQEDQERGMVMQRMADDIRSQKAAGDWLKENMVLGPDGTPTLSADAGKSFIAHMAGMQPAQLDEGMRVMQAQQDHNMKPIDHADAITSVQTMFLQGADPAKTTQFVDLMIAQKKITYETGQEWKAVLDSPVAPQLQDPIVHGLYEKAGAAVNLAIGGPNLGIMGQLTKSGDQALANTAMLHITQQLAGMDKTHIMDALDPTSPNSLVSPKALAIYIAQKPAFDKMYSGFDNQGGVNPNGGRPPLAAPVLNFGPGR